MTYFLSYHISSATRDWHLACDPAYDLIAFRELVVSDQEHRKTLRKNLINYILLPTVTIYVNINDITSRV